VAEMRILSTGFSLMINKNADNVKTYFLEKEKHSVYYGGNTASLNKITSEMQSSKG
jgi:hypothetical protein